MRISPAAAALLLCCAAAAGPLHTELQAAPQEQTGDSLNRIKQGLDRPAVSLKPSGELQLRPTFKSEVTKHPFVPTLEEHLHKTFELTDFQRKYAEYAARCCGVDLAALVRQIDGALDERRTRNIRAQIARELAELERARAAQIR
jgi:hypothetical protein